MSDITLNTKRFTLTSGFAGASTNDLIRIAAQAIEYAGEQGDAANLGAIHRMIRVDADSVDGCPANDQFTFDYDGMTFRIVTEDVMESMKQDAIDNMVYEAQYELEQMKKNACYLSNYITIDEDMFRRDMEMDVDNWVSPYDGVVHEMYVNEYGAGRTCCGYANDANPDVVIRRETLFMIRED